MINLPGSSSDLPVGYRMAAAAEKLKQLLQA
jgi:hypothetical protein